MASQKEESTEKESRRIIKMAMNRRLNQFKLAFEEYASTYDRVVFKSSVKSAIKSQGIKLRRIALDEYLMDVKKMRIPITDKDIIGYEYEQEMDRLMKLAINYSSICTTVKEVLIVVGGLAAMLAAGYLVFQFVTLYGLTATLSGLAAIIQFFKTHVRTLA